MTRAPWPVMGSKSEQLLARLVNAVHAVVDTTEATPEQYARADEVLAEADRYLAEIDQFVDRMHRRDMGERI